MKKINTQNIEREINHQAVAELQKDLEVDLIVN
jgi:hypothetical protein